MDALLEATQVTTAPRRLARLATHPAPEVRRAVAANPNTPTQVLLRLAVHFPEEVLRNPVLELLLLENPNLLAEMRPESRDRLLGSPACWPEFVRWALKYGEEEALLALCRNPLLPREALEALQSYPSEKVQQAARLHLGSQAEARAEAALLEASTEADSAQLFDALALGLVPPWLLGRIAQAPDYALRQAVAAHPQAPPEILAQLLLDEAEEVRQAAAENPRTPQVARRFAQDLLLGRPLPPERLLELSERTPGLRPLLLSHPSFPSGALRTFAFDEDWRIRQAVARNPQLDRRLLRRLGQDPDRDVRKAVAANPAAPPDLLERLLCDADEEVRQAVLANPAVPRQTLGWLERLRRADPGLSPELLARLALEKPWARRWAAAHPALPEGVLESCAKDAEWQVRQAVAHNPNTPASVLALLSSDLDHDVRQAVAQHPHTPPEILLVLSQDENPEVRIRVARRSGISPALLERMAEDPHWMVRQAVAQNPATLPSVLRRLFEDTDRDVRQAAGDNPALPLSAIQALFAPFLETLPSAPLLYRRIRAQRSPVDPAVLAHLGRGEEWSRQLAARHPDTPRQTLLELLSDENWRVRQALTHNPALPPELLGLLAQDSDADVRQGVALHPSTPGEVLLALARDEHLEVRRKAAQNPALPEEARLWLLLDEDESLQAAVRRNPGLSSHTLELARRALALQPLELARLEQLARGSASCRRLAAANPSTPRAVLERLVRDTDWRVRQAVARNPSTPPDLLAALATDTDRDVRQAVAAHPAVAREALEGLLSDPDELVRRSAWHNPRTDESLRQASRERLLREGCRSRYSLNRVVALAHPETPAAELRKVRNWAAGEWLVRYALARNPSTPLEVLRHLAAFDGNRVVRQAAREHLRERSPGDGLPPPHQPEAGS
jgi:hypothetical protein